jgi:hypothetical protein
LKPDADLSAFVERFAAFDAVLAERHLEALLGHAYAAAARDPEDLYYQDPTFVRKHSFRFDEKGGEIVRTPFSPPVLVREGGGGGSRIAGSIFRPDGDPGSAARGPAHVRFGRPDRQRGNRSFFFH